MNGETHLNATVGSFNGASPMEPRSSDPLQSTGRIHPRSARRQYRAYQEGPQVVTIAHALRRDCTESQSKPLSRDVDVDVYVYDAALAAYKGHMRLVDP
ncbi:hypothetical protein ACFX5Q_28490 [Mesorhizobium sp. IMUNJ 23033]|uniref:hypothetical protein n=1 Tax=Mesorhizobium sp. IMUNJ 23033 TaxID=3378039 RepID=UPI00384C46FA